MDFSETIAACDLKVNRCRYVSTEGQSQSFTIFFQVLYILCFTRPRYQVSIYRTIGHLVSCVGAATSSRGHNLVFSALKKR